MVSPAKCTPLRDIIIVNTISGELKMLDEECKNRLEEIIDDSSDAGFEFEPPTDLADAKNKIAKMIMFNLDEIHKEFDIGRWNNAEQKRLIKATSYFFKVFDKWTLNKGAELDIGFDVKQIKIQTPQIDTGNVLEFEVSAEIDESVKTLNDYLVIEC